jgi:prepilin-type N-terminal cleavage/methylation domain-containing protein
VKFTSASPTPAVAPSRGGRRRQRGFTLLETMMASFVMALGISTSIIAMQQGYKFLDVARGTTLASQIIQSEIERIRMMNWSTVSAMATATDTTAPFPSGSPAGVEMFDGATYFSGVSSLTGDYTMTRTVTLDGTRPGEVALITISVEWRTYDGRTQTRSFQMKYMKNGLYDYYYTSAAPVT